GDGLVRDRLIHRWLLSGLCVLLAGLEPANPFGYAILNRARFPAFATGAGSPCLLVKGADCAGVCLAVLAWLCPGLSRDARSRVARIKLFPALTGRGFGVASGATKLVPAFLSVLAQCRKQCPSLMGVPCSFFTIRRGRLLRLPLRPSPRRNPGTSRRGCIRPRIRRGRTFRASGRGVLMRQWRRPRTVGTFRYQCLRPRIASGCGGSSSGGLRVPAR